MMSVLFSPHNDDEALFACYTLMRHKPLVVIVTDGFIQGNRGDPITAEQRRKETEKAMGLLGCSVFFAGLRDDQLDRGQVEKLLKGFKNFDQVFVPAIQDGNWQHDLIGTVAKEVFHSVISYTTYTKSSLWTKGSIEINPTDYEIAMKNEVLDCYQSQINLPATAPHFTAVRGNSEFYA